VTKGIGVVLLLGSLAYAADCPLTIEKVSPGSGTPGRESLIVHMRNTTDKTITALKLSSEFFDAVHDPVGLPAFGMFEEKVLPGNKKNLVWKFDVTTSQEYVQMKSTTVKVQKLAFSDGSVWEDQHHACSAEWSRK